MRRIEVRALTNIGVLTEKHIRFTKSKRIFKGVIDSEIADFIDDFKIDTANIEAYYVTFYNDNNNKEIAEFILNSNLAFIDVYVR